MIKTAKSAGFCFGVDRSVKLVYALLEKGEKIATVGPIIHNPFVVEDLKEKGVITEENIADIPKGYTAVIRSHGVPLSVYNELSEKDVNFRDATCPFVSKIHAIVREEYQSGKKILIAGNKNHPEIIGINGFCENRAIVFKNEEELIKLSQNGEINGENDYVLVAQTTFNKNEWQKCIKFLKKLYTNIRFFDTICNATAERQLEAEKIAAESDIMFVIGGRNSSNTNRLREVCEKYCKTVLIQSASELEKQDLIGKFRIGITAGASTPAYIIEEVQNKMSELLENEEFSFEEALEQSFKKIYRGAKVKGVVAFVAQNEIGVDIGSKYAGYVPFSEYSDDPEANPNDLKRGDELDLVVVSVSDQEGRAMLSKKRFDKTDSFNKIEAAYNDGALLEGTITDVVNGGVIAFTMGSRVFIPASQTGVKKGDDMSVLKGKKVTFKLIDLNAQRHRAVGSITAPEREKRKAEAEKFWNEAKVGDTYTAKIKSLTSFGAFADLGGVDGLIHLTELSWKRIKNPSEVVSVGDEVEVYIKELDAEKKRISLGYKKAEDNPWEKIKAVNVGDVVKVKIVSSTKFGLFANVIDGIDGLIHITELSWDRVENPTDIIKVGEETDAKIIAIDYENKKVSLSVKQLTEKPAASVEEASAE
ncbi:MAG: bifunctional 4-hydroxy-3-methylbut-2-enyl diphosphate reductase/30S ribosomal protein S1 [Oscillospiraceae bacterium]|nr:bifunctional 4-hydroxy-3-methylbut-2-enyl diphosphate reductase/30S ribosomal protein S1 [Oscillospiraceae bacterium]